MLQDIIWWCAIFQHTILIVSVSVWRLQYPPNPLYFDDVQLVKEWIIFFLIGMMDPPNKKNLFERLEQHRRIKFEWLWINHKEKEEQECAQADSSRLTIRYIWLMMMSTQVGIDFDQCRWVGWWVVVYKLHDIYIYIHVAVRDFDFVRKKHAPCLYS